MKRPSSIVAVFVVVIATMLLSSCAEKGKENADVSIPAEETAGDQPDKTKDDIENLREFIRSEKYIVHGCGFLEEADGNYASLTNSYEAMEAAYEAGNRLLEMDFLITADNYLVAGHDIEDETWAIGINIPRDTDVTREMFLNEKWCDKYTTMDLNSVAEYMREHEDFYVITDVKYDNAAACRIIADTCPDLIDRFIVQIYHEDEYTPVHDMGFPYIIYTMYKVTDEEREPSHIAEIFDKDDLLGITFDYRRIDDSPEYFEEVKAMGFPLYVHTVNYPEEMDHCFAGGIDAVYTDWTKTGLSKYIQEHS